MARKSALGASQTRYFDCRVRVLVYDNTIGSYEGRMENSRVEIDGELVDLIALHDALRERYGDNCELVSWRESCVLPIKVVGRAIRPDGNY